MSGRIVFDFVASRFDRQKDAGVILSLSSLDHTTRIDCPCIGVGDNLGFSADLAYFSHMQGNHRHGAGVGAEPT